MKRFLFCSLFASSLVASSVQVNINNDTLEVKSDVYLNNHYNVNDSSDYYFTIGYLGTASDKTTSSQKITSMGLKVLNPYTDDNGISLGIGMKVVYTKQNDKMFTSIPLCAYAKFELNELIYFDLEVAYAPRVLSFSDAEGYKDARFKANYKVLENGYVYIGTRDIITKYEDGNEIRYDTSAFVGYEVKF
jgi:hypothetical protein